MTSPPATTPVATTRPMRFRCFLGAAVLSCCALLAACSSGREPAPLALDTEARQAMDRVDQLITAAHAFLGDEVPTHPRVAALLAGQPTADTPEVPWQQTPYIAVGVLDGRGVLLTALPSAGTGTRNMLAAASSGPEIGDFHLIPNAYAFTLPMYRKIADDRILSALVDVEQTLGSELLEPLAASVDGIALIANRSGRVVLATHPALRGRALSELGIPMAEPGAGEIADVTLDGARYRVGVAASNRIHPWQVGIAVPRDGGER